MTEFSLRAARETDYDRLLPLCKQFYLELSLPEAAGRIPSTLEGVLAREDTVAFLADSPVKIIGFAAMSTSYGLEAGLYCELEDLFVLPEWRGHGVASSLIDAAISWANAQGCHDMEVVLTRESQQDRHLLSWYEKRRYVETGRTILPRTLGA